MKPLKWHVQCACTRLNRNKFPINSYFVTCENHDANIALGNGVTANVNESSHVLLLHAATHGKRQFCEGRGADCPRAIKDHRKSHRRVHAHTECASYFAAGYDADCSGNAHMPDSQCKHCTITAGIPLLNPAADNLLPAPKLPDGEAPHFSHSSPGLYAL